MAENLHHARLVVIRRTVDVELRIDGQRRLGALRQTILRIPLSRYAAHKLAVALLQACAPEGGEA